MFVTGNDYSKFKKINDLFWKFDGNYYWLERDDASELVGMLRERYQTAQIHKERDPRVAYVNNEVYDVFILFDNSADEAEFIMKESI